MTNAPAAPLNDAWPLPVVDVDPSLFAHMRTAFERAGFNDPTIRQRFGLETLVEFISLRGGRTPGQRYGDALEVLTDLFMDLTDVPEADARRVLGDDAVDAFLATQLLRPDGADGALRSIMLLYPAAGVLLASDRTFTHTGEVRAVRTDIVYSALTRNTSNFWRMMPRARCEAFLELCAGNGVAAIGMASSAGHSWSLDLTERSTQVAQFNALLNGSDNVTVLQGDLFEPVRGLTFDRIVAHPPYVPSSTQTMIYRDGGQDGEFITRRIITELPGFLRPGGRFYCTCLATDRVNAPFEDRLREWLGEAHREFDVVVAETSVEHPSEHYFKSALHGQRTFADAGVLHERFKEMQVATLVYSSFILERHATPRTPMTVRLKRSAATTGRELEQYVDWLSRRDTPDLVARVMTAYPVLHRQAVLQTTQRLRDNQWTPTSMECHTLWPFIANIECPNDVAQLLARCDGTRTVAQLITWLRQKGYLKSDVPDLAVVETITNCASVGALHLSDYALAGGSA